MPAIDRNMVCQICGKEFVTKNPHAKYCSKKCSNDSYKIRPKTIEKKVKKKSIAEIDAEARNAHMTYGKYVAMMGL